MTFLSAPPNTGLRFRRVDLEGKPEIEARIDFPDEGIEAADLDRLTSAFESILRGIEELLATRRRGHTESIQSAAAD